jgi:hypothetical protein
MLRAINNVDKILLEALIINPAFSAVPDSDLVVAHSTKNIYNDFGFKWNNSGKNGFYCKFKYSSS